jgi:hypothetical protein
MKRRQQIKEISASSLKDINGVMLVHFYIYWTAKQLSTLLALPWLEHTHENDRNDDKKDDNCKAHPFPRVLL